MLNIPREPTKGDDILPWATRVQDCLRRLRITGGPGVLIQSTANGTTISVDPRGGRAAPARPHPFQVFTRSEPGNAGRLEAGVCHQSFLAQSLRPDGPRIPITGILSGEVSDPATTGWFALQPSDAIWLEITFHPELVAEIKSWGQGGSFDLHEDAWSGHDSYCEDDAAQENPQHLTARKLIAYAVPGAIGEPVLTQTMCEHQILRHVCIDGRPARYPFPFDGGYYP